MRLSKTPTLPDAVASVSARLALRQQNLVALMPVLLHDINGSLNGLSLSTELLSRLQQRATADPATAADLLRRTCNELGRLKLALKALESRVAPGVLGQVPARESPLVSTVKQVLAVLLPALRRGQHELHASLEIAEIPVEAGPDDLFDLLAGLIIVTIDAAPPHCALDVSIVSTDRLATITIAHASQPRSGMGHEIHRELLRTAALLAGGTVEWQQSAAGSRGRLRLRRALMLA